jgi:thioredoxin-dependent peroxiredoxin|tara:strand:+ start:539 stop:1000 length:462 start_codon:yes stop_codon:yes gene_type:complete
MQNINLNDKVPNFELEGTSNLAFNLKNFLGKYIIIYFYPKDSTPGCTNEGIDFTENINKFKKLNVEIFGISRDSLKSHENFKKKYNFPFELLSDHEESASTLFNVIKMKNMYGKKVRGIERSTFLINPEGKLIHEWRGVKVNGHINEILELLS